MSSHVQESAVIAAPIEKVWELVRPLDFSFLPSVEKVEVEGKGSPGSVGSVISIHYKDSTVQRIKLMGLSDINYSVTYDLIESKPAVKFFSAIYTVELKRVTAGDDTFIKWSTDFSSDAGQDVIQDSKFKKLEAFKALHGLVKASEKILLYRQLSEPTRFPATSGTSFQSKDAMKSDADSRPSLD